MANTIKPKRSYTASATPTLAAGELAIQAADKKVFIGNSSGTGNILVASLNGADITGTVASATNATTATSATSATTATNLAGGGAGQLPYQSSSGTTAMLAAGTSGQVLRSNGSSAPSWETQGFFSSGRLTLESNVPVSTADQTSKTAVYFTPYNGDKISIYNGTSWATYTFSQLTLNFGTLTSGKNYDVFIYNNSGTLTLELSAAWTSDTARSEALTLTNGIYVKSSANTRRYLGTIRTTSTTTTEDSVSKRFVWNLDNPVDRPIYKTNTTQHTPGAGTATGWRNWNADSTARIEFVFGLDSAFVIGFGGAATATASPWSIDMGAAFDGGSPGYDSVQASFSGTSQLRSGRTYTSRGSFIGYHYCQIKQYVQSPATSNTFYDGRLEGLICC